MSLQEIFEVIIVLIFKSLVLSTALIQIHDWIANFQTWRSGDVKKFIQRALINEGTNFDNLAKIVNVEVPILGQLKPCAQSDTPHSIMQRSIATAVLKAKETANGRHYPE